MAAPGTSRRLGGVAALGALVAVGSYATPARAALAIACVGASTTSGDGSSAGHHYPDELQRLVGAAGVVHNFGVSGTTMLRNVSATYWKTPQLPAALASSPDIVIIWFGGNDAKPENWTTHKGEFLGDYEAMIHMFQALPSHPRTYVVLSLVTHDTEGIPKVVVDNEVIPLVRQAAAETGSGVVDVHDDLANHPEYFPDGIHPNDTGTVAVAKLVYAVITAPPADGGADAPSGDAPSAAADAPALETAPMATDGGGAPDERPPAPPEASSDAASNALGPPDASGATGGAPGGATGGTPSGAPTDGAVSPTTPAGPSHKGSGCAVVDGAPVSETALLALLCFIVAAARARARQRTVGAPATRGP